MGQLGQLIARGNLHFYKKGGATWQYKDGCTSAFFKYNYAQMCMTLW